MKRKLVGALSAAAVVGAVLIKIVEALLDVLKEVPLDPAAADSTVVAITHFLGIG